MNIVQETELINFTLHMENYFQQNKYLMNDERKFEAIRIYNKIRVSDKLWVKQIIGINLACFNIPDDEEFDENIPLLEFTYKVIDWLIEVCEYINHSVLKLNTSFNYCLFSPYNSAAVIYENNGISKGRLKFERIEEDTHIIHLQKY